MRDWQKDWELSQAATPGPWICKDGTIRNTYGAMVLGTYQDFDTEVGEWVPKLDYSDKDMNFILAAREALPYWLQRVRKLEVQIASVKEVFAAEDKYAEHQEHCELCDNGSMPLCPVGSKLHEKWVDLRWKAFKALEDGEQDA